MLKVMTDTKELIERLRGAAFNYEDNLSKIAREAIHELERLTAALAEAEKDRDGWKQAAQVIGERLSKVGPPDYYNMPSIVWFEWATAATNGIAESEAENKRLKEALRGVIAVSDRDTDEYTEARAALG